MSRQSVVDRLQGSNERLQGALIAGEDTAPHRAVIERLEAALVAIDEEERRSASAEIASAAIKQGELAALIEQNAGDGIVAALARHPVPNFTIEGNMIIDPAVSTATKALASAQTKYADAALAYEEVASSATSLRSRLGDLENAAKSISDQRRSGQVTDREAAGLLAFNLEDQADLKKLLEAAEQKKQLLTPNHGPVIYAQEVLERTIKVVLFAKFQQRAKAMESAFLDIVADLYEAGVSIGNSPMLGSSWVPSRELSDLLHFGVPPKVRDAS